MKHAKLLLLTVFLIGLGLRFYNLSENPPGLYWDEASIAYNAYSILETGKDEFAQQYPFWFKAFGEYKLPGYLYTTSASMTIFGPTDFAVRFPSALAGTLSILIIYLLALELFSKHKRAEMISVLCSLFFAISPWSIQFSRAGFEANLALLFILLGSYLMLKALTLKRNLHVFSASGLSFLAAVFTYNSARLFVPLLLITSLVIFYKLILRHRGPVSKAIIITLVVALPFLPQQFGEQSTIRAASTSYIGKKSASESLDQFIKQYSDHFDTNFLFFHGDSVGRHSTRKLGMLHFFELPLILLGIYALTKTKPQPRNFILAWLFLAPLPAAITEPAPHALRALNMLPAWVIISALGFNFILTQLSSKLKSLPLRQASYLALGLIVIYFVALFNVEYHVRYPRVTALDWSDGVKEAVEVVKDKRDNYDTVYLSNNVPLNYLGFYLPIKPADYHQMEDKNVKNHLQIGNIQYFNLAWDVTPPENSKVLFIAPHWQKPPEGSPFETINLKNGDIFLNIWEVNAIDESL